MSQYKLFETFQEAVIVVDGDGRLVAGNTAASLLLDINERRLSSKKEISQFLTFDPPILEGGSAFSKVLEATQMREVNYTSNASGKTGSVQVFVQPQPVCFKTDSAEEDRWVINFRDVSLEKILADKYKGELDQKEAVIEQLKAAREKLEEYSHGLEKIVAERTAELQAKNSLLKTILDSLGQGILVFDESGKCLPIYSQVCQKMFGISPEAKAVGEVLGLKGSETETFEQWREAVFAQMLDFDELIPLAPSRLTSLPPPTEIALNYSVLANDGKIDGVVVIATDRTKEVEALKAAQHEKELVRRIVQVAKHRNAFQMFAADAASLLADLQAKKTLSIEELKRKMHTVKGGAATFGLAELAHECHELETQIETAIPSVEELAKHGSKFRDLLDKDVNEISDLLGLSSASGSDSDTFVLEDILSVHLSTLKEIAQQLEKAPPKIVFEASNVRFKKTEHASLVNSFVHAFRNSIDHGIETKEERIGAGKSEAGQITVRAENGGDRINIVIADDGRGVNVDKLRQRLVEKSHAKAKASDDEVIQTLLEGDLSTKDTVTDISGRGIGVSAVAAEVEKLGGQIKLVSDPGHGLSVVMWIPVSHSHAVKAA
ncbi:MAG TPA: ATP-binding protein [Bdellovibrionales bacterium]|nr:ATP-binding protein [Bdellovibrionales bacterium]